LASEARIHFDNTKGLLIGRLKGRKPRFKKITWVTTNVKTLGVHHGYNIDNEAIWKSKVVKIKICLQIWKKRNLTFKGNILIVKKLIIPSIGYEIEIRGIPENHLKIIKKIIWGFIWRNKVNLLDRNVCCMNIEEGGDRDDTFIFVCKEQTN
jgi:hypothetical protein